MKRFLLYTLAAVFFLSIHACKDDDDNNVGSVSAVNMQFKASYDGVPLVMTDSYTYIDDLPLFFTRFNFFISNISLISSDGSVTELSEVEKLDFTTINIDPETAAQGIDFTFSDIPTGEYTGLSFGIGLPADLNATIPEDYSSSHPLSDVSDYWGAWQSYIFTKIEGKVDINQDNTYGLGIVYHLGSDDLYREVTFNKPITITTSNETLPALEIDLKKILVRSDANFLDVETNSAVHNDRDLMNYIMDNFDDAIELN